MSRYELTRWSGLAGLVSGLLIIVGAVSRPFFEPVVTGTLLMSGHILLFFLLTGVYGMTYSHIGILGLSGYVLSTIGNALFVIASSFVLSRIDVGEDMSPAAGPAIGILFSIGLLLIAITITRIRALPAWPGWIMFAGMALNLLLPRVLNDAPDLVLAISPVLLGFGIVGYGWEFRRN
jgi:hypothetical protein